MLLIKKEPEDLYRLHEEQKEKSPLSKGKTSVENVGYNPETRRARYLRNKAKKLNGGK